MILLLLIFILFVSPSFVQASEEIPVKVKAEKLKYIEEEGVVYATGSVEVELKEVKIFADRLVMDTATNVVTAEGRVRMVAAEYAATADWVTYNATSEISSFSHFRSKVLPTKMKDYLFMEVAELTDYQKEMRGSQGEVTTCSYDPVHYFMLAEKIEYYPDDKIVGWDVTLYVGKLPVLWMPYLMYDLRQKQKRNWRFGHNEVEGDFLKTAWDYPGGILYLDFMQKKGTGYGISAPYAFLGLGTLYLYHVDEADTGVSDWVTKIDHRRNLNPSTTLRLKNDYSSIYQIPSGRLDQTAWEGNLDYQKDQAKWGLKLNTFDNRLSSNKKIFLGLDQSYQKTSTQYSLNYEFSERNPAWIRNAQRLYHQYPLRENITFYTTLNYYDSIASRGEIGDQRMDSNIELRGKEKEFSWKYTDQRYFDIEGDRYTGDDGLSFNERKPELEVYPNKLDLKFFSLSSTLGYGVYREVKYVSELGGMRDFQTGRYKAQLSADRSVPLVLGTTLGLGAGILQYAYDPGDQLYAYDEKMSLRTDLFSFFKNEASYDRGYTEGNTPFFFDRLGTRKHFVKERLTLYCKDKVDWTTWTGFNYLTSKYDDLMTALNFKPTQKLRLSLNTGWDIENKIYKDLVVGLSLAPHSFFSSDLSATHDLNQGELKSGHALFGLLLLEGTPNQWKIQTSYIYDRPKKEIKMRDIMITKDVHCWEIKYTYSDYLKQFSLTFSLKAMPDEPVGVSSTRGLYFDGFEKELKELEGEREIRRY